MKRYVLALLATGICVWPLAAAGVLPRNAAAAVTPPPPAVLAIYARGWIDGAAPPGVYVTHASCTRARVCTVHLNDGSCARATITGYRFPGPWHRCRKGPKS
jgi:hypothetical protein